MNIDKLIDTFELTMENFNKIRPYVCFYNNKKLSAYLSYDSLLNKSKEINENRLIKIDFEYFTTDVKEGSTLEESLKRILMTIYYGKKFDPEKVFKGIQTDLDYFNSTYTLWIQHQLCGNKNNNFSPEEEIIISRFIELDKISINYFIEDYLKWAES